MKLYDIKEAYLRLLDMDLDDETFQDTLESLEFDFEEKADNIACLVKSLELESAAITEEAKNLLKRAQAKQQKAEYLKQYLHDAFKSLNKDKLETTRNLIQVKKNPVSVELHECFCEKEYMVEKVTSTPDKVKIKEDLKAGIVIPGAKLIQKERLEIK